MAVNRIAMIKGTISHAGNTNVLSEVKVLLPCYVEYGEIRLVMALMAKNT